ncbi:DUF6998 domain-containing protein [Microbacterium sp. NPDC055683]
MQPADTTAMTLAELLSTQAAIATELQRRGLVRTSTSLAGELAEHLAQRVYGGELPPPTNRAVDLIDAHNRRIQVKARHLPHGVQRHFAFAEGLDFDLAIAIRFDRATWELVYAREFNVEELHPLLSPHADGPRLTTARAARNGKDVTGAFREAYAQL